MVTDKGMRMLSKIRQSIVNAFEEGDMDSFLHHAFRYIEIRKYVYPGEKCKTPGDVLNNVIEEKVFNSSF